MKRILFLLLLFSSAYGQTVYITTSAKTAVNVLDYGAKADVKIVYDAAMTSGSANLTSATAAFTSADVGKLIQVKSALSGNHPLLGTISSFTSSTVVVLSVSATATISGKQATYGTDNRTAFQNAANAAYTLKKALYLPAGDWATSADAVEGYCIGLKPGVFFGDGPTSRIFKLDINGYCVQFHDAATAALPINQRNFEIRDLQIINASDGFNSPSSTGSGSDGGIFIARGNPTAIATNNVLVENVTVRESNKESIAAWNCNHFTVRNCKVDSSGFDALNPVNIQHLEILNNYISNSRFGMEFAASMSDGTAGSTTTLVEGNVFDNIQEYGIAIYSGTSIQVHNNIFRGADVWSSVSGVAMGIYIDRGPDYATPQPLGDIDISGNYFYNFWTTQIGTAAPDVTDRTINNLRIHANKFFNSGHSAINISNYSGAKIKYTEISNNSIVDWLRDSTSSSFEYCAISLRNFTNGCIKDNRIYNTIVRAGNSAPNRADPLNLWDCSNVLFAGNDLAGMASQYSSVLTIRFSAGTTTGLTVWNNNNLEGISAGQPMRHEVANVAYTLLEWDHDVVYTSLTASRAVTLPTAASVSGKHFMIKDESGNASGTIKITIVGTVGTVSNPNAVTTARGVYRFYSNGTTFETE